MNDGSSMEMPRYTCYKKVHALKIKEIHDATLVFEKEEYAPIEVSNEYMTKHAPIVGGYYVVYKGGYTSFSPAEAFEGGYALADDQMEDPTPQDNQTIFATQDPKYVIISNRLCVAATLEPIPEDEPLFIMRGKDRHAYATLDYYKGRCLDENHVATVDLRMLEFGEFHENNPGRMNEPDTDISIPDTEFGSGDYGEDADREMVGDDSGMVDNIGDK